MKCKTFVCVCGGGGGGGLHVKEGACPGNMKFDRCVKE